MPGELPQQNRVDNAENTGDDRTENDVASYPEDNESLGND